MKKSEVSMAKIRESFGKILVEGDVQTMCLPFNFCRKYGNSIRKTMWVEFSGGDNWRVRVGKKHMFSASGKLEEIRTFDEGWADVTEFYGVKTGDIAQVMFKGTTGFFIRFFTVDNKEINYTSRSTSSSGFVRDATDDSSSSNLLDEMVTDEEDVEYESCRPGCFTKKFQPNDSKKLYLRKGFFTQAELGHLKEVRVYMEGCNMFTEIAVKCRENDQTGELYGATLLGSMDSNLGIMFTSMPNMMLQVTHSG